MASAIFASGEQAEPGATVTPGQIDQDGGYETVAALLREALQKYSAHTVYIEQDVSTTLGEHIADARSFAALLRDKFDVQPGDRVAALALTSRAYLALWHAAMLGHFTLIPLNYRLAPAELIELLRNAAPKLLLQEADFSAAASEAVAALGNDIVLSDFAVLDQATRNAVEAADPAAGADDLAVIMYTSGTTGLPKGVEMTQYALARTCDRQHYFWDIRAAGTCLYTTTPLFHVSAIFAALGPVTEGNRTVISASFDIDKLMADSRRYKVTHMALVAVMIRRFLDHELFRMAEQQHIRYIIYGGSPVPTATILDLATNLPGTDLLQSYGMTEALGASTVLDGEDHRAGGGRLLSCGRALPKVEVRIRMADGRLGAVGEVGQIELRSDAMLSGYWRNPVATRSALVDGWYSTGDLGQIDAEGYIFVVDRLKDMIISGGENIYCAEVEQAIGLISGVLQVAVIGVPSEMWGEQVHAIVLLESGAELNAEQLIGATRQRLAAYKCPKSVEFRTEALPISGTNKINKRALREEYRMKSNKRHNAHAGR